MAAYVITFVIIGRRDKAHPTTWTVLLNEGLKSVPWFFVVYLIAELVRHR